MLGGTLALMTRGLRLDSRMLRSHLFRLLFVVIILLALNLSHWSGLFVGAPGLMFFQYMAFLNVAFITLAAVSFFATSITEEKEEETLGLLKMAGINAFSILFGKSMPRLIVALLLLSVQFPFTLLAITLGGVTLHQVFATYFALLAYLFLTANLGLLCSVVRKRSSAASGLATSILFLYLAGVPIAQQFLGALIAEWGLTAGWQVSLQVTLQGVYSSSIIARLLAIMTTGFNDPLVSVQVAGNSILGVLCFALSWLLFDVCTREQKPITEKRTWSFRRTSLLGGLGTGRAWRLAVLWKEFHFAAGGRIGLFIKFLIYPAVAVGVYLLTAAATQSRFKATELGVAALFLTIPGLLIEASIYASRIFHAEVKWRTLPALMMLPQSTARIAYSKVAGCLIGLLPATFWSLVAAKVAGAEFGNLVAEFRDEPGAWFVAFQFILFLHLTAYLSLTIKWGALPLSFAIVYIAISCCSFPVLGVVAGPGEGVFGFFSFVELVVIAALHPLIGYRLQEVAAQ